MSPDAPSAEALSRSASADLEHVDELEPTPTTAGAVLLLLLTSTRPNRKANR